MKVQGTFNGKPVRFLVDSGAMVSVVRKEFVCDSQHIVTTQQTMLSNANGLPLVAVGETEAVVTVGGFNTEHVFVVVEDLAVECILGADFLSDNEAVLDCHHKTLSLKAKETSNAASQVDSHMEKVKLISCVVHLPSTLQVQPRSAQLCLGQLESAMCTGISSGLVEPVDLTGKSKHVLIARSISPVESSNRVVLQLINTGSKEVTLYKGMKVATFTPQQNVTVFDNFTQGMQDQTDFINVVNESHAELSMDPKEEPLEIDLKESNLNHEQKEELLSLLQNFKDVFVSNTAPLGRTSAVQHTIVTEGPPIRQPQRRLPFSLKTQTKTEIETMLKQGVIRPSNSPWSSPIVLVKKKDGSWRFCIDYRRLNTITHKDAYPLPRIDETLDSLSGAQYFTTLDLASGYWQVEVKEEHKEKTAFSTPFGHFEFNVMPFGLTNAPATFQRLMECVLAGLSPEECLIYLDDVIIFSSSFIDHLKSLYNVLERLRSSGLRLKLKKCQFAKQQVLYLGHIVSSKGVQPDPKNTEAVILFPTPTDIKELRQFLGLTNYYRKFIKDYAKIANPLYELTRKTARGYQWSSSCQESFETLKQKLVNPPVLVYPDFRVPFIVHTDASESAIGGILSQNQEGRERVIAYWSRQLQKSERNYSTIEREALAVISAVKEFYPYLYGFNFTLVTDHNPLTTLKALKDVGGRLARWMLFLQQFSFEFQYKPGSQHTNADCMSRIPPLQKPQVAAVTSQADPFTITDIKEAQSQDKTITDAMNALRKGKLPSNFPESDRFVIKDGLLCRKLSKGEARGSHQIVVPHTLQDCVLKQLHDGSGHLGKKKTFKKVQAHYYWPGYSNDVARWIQQCHRCQQRQDPQPKPCAPLSTISSEFPFQRLSWDIMGPLPTSEQGNKYILVITDMFSKWVEAFAIKDTTSSTLAKILVDQIICRYGVPVSIHSDQGANLCSDLIQKTCDLLGIHRTQTSAYHPQGNGQVERFNRTLQAMLSKMIEEQQTTWDQHLQKALFAYRTSIHESSGFSPFLLTFGRSPILPIDVMLGVADVIGKEGREEGHNLPHYVSSLQQSLSKWFKTVRQQLRKAHQKQKKQYDHAIAGDSLEVGDRVWLFVPAIKKGSTKKLASRWKGPFTIVDKTSPVCYRIQLWKQGKTMVVHRNRLKLCFGEPVTQRKRTQAPRTEKTHLTPLGKSCTNQQTTLTSHKPPMNTVQSNVDARLSVKEAAGYTSIDQGGSSASDTRRSQRSRRPPARYNDYISIAETCEDASI